MPSVVLVVRYRGRSVGEPILALLARTSSGSRRRAPLDGSALRTSAGWCWRANRMVIDARSSAAIRLDGVVVVTHAGRPSTRSRQLRGRLDARDLAAVAEPVHPLEQWHGDAPQNVTLGRPERDWRAW